MKRRMGRDSILFPNLFYPRPPNGLQLLLQIKSSGELPLFIKLQMNDNKVVKKIQIYHTPLKDSFQENMYHVYPTFEFNIGISYIKWWSKGT
jgi:hypothetical protein